MHRSGHVVALIALLGGCIGSSVPQPPNLAPVDPDRVRGMGTEMTGFPLIGAPGAAPPDAEVWAWNLETSDPPSVAATDEQGAFTVQIFGTLGNAVRLQVRRGDDRSVPVDVIPWLERADLVPRAACFEVPRELVVEEPRSVELPLRNRCGVEGSVQAVRLRVGDAFFVVPPGDSRLPDIGDVLVGVEAPVESAEDILIIEIELGGMSFRYAVTLIAR